MRKYILIITSFFTIIFLLSCSGVEIQFKPNELMVKEPKKILIGAFENRMLEYNPFIIKDFKDALKFEFLKLGYDTELISSSESKKGDNFTCADNKIQYAETKEQQKGKVNSVAAHQEAIMLCCDKYTSDMFIKGTISILETGELTSSKASTFISVMIFNKNGDKIGEAHYSGSGQMGDAKSIKKIAKQFAGEINAELRKTREDDDKSLIGKIKSFLVD